MIVADVSLHLDTFTLPEPNALVFTSPRGKLLRHPNFRRGVWYPALAATGLSVHLHDLRHTGNQLTADAGANLRELMERMGHSSSRCSPNSARRICRNERCGTRLARQRQH